MRLCRRARYRGRQVAAGFLRQPLPRALHTTHRIPICSPRIPFQHDLRSNKSKEMTMKSSKSPAKGKSSAKPDALAKGGKLKGTQLDERALGKVSGGLPAVQDKGRSRD